jgi:hypothetical protein
MSNNLTIPNRFESLQAAFGNEVRPLILPVDEDLKAFLRFREQVKVQNGGILCFLLGSTGVGKTTSVYSATTAMPDEFTSVVSVPIEIEFKEVIKWLNSNLPPIFINKSLIVLFDGREISDDDVGVRQFLSGLNQFLRRRPDIIFCWPTTDSEWHKYVRDLAEKIGGNNFAPQEGSYQVIGPKREDWNTALERLLLQFGKNFDDLGISSDTIDSINTSSYTIGDFLTRIGSSIAIQISQKQQAKKLPQVVFVITSSGDVMGEANRIRRGGKQSIASEPLLTHSPRSEAGRWWAERNKISEHNLGYIISLFQASLVTMSASAVVHSCMQFGAPDLKIIPEEHGVRKDKGNAMRIIHASEAYRFINQQPSPEFTSGRKGHRSDITIESYSKIQMLSAKRHKAINQAIFALIVEHTENIKPEDIAFEVSQNGEVITDLVLNRGSELMHIEFHHLSERKCRAASMASYIMDKLRIYAIYHQLIPQ